MDYGQIVKVYTHDAIQHPERKYSAPSFASAMHRPITGSPDMELVSTSYIERLNATLRARLAVLVRRTRGTARRQARLQAGM